MLKQFITASDVTDGGAEERIPPPLAIPNVKTGPPP